MVASLAESSTIIWVTLIVLVLIYWYRKIRKLQNYWEERGIKYIKPWFLIGNMSLYPFKNIAYYMCDLYKEFPTERYHGIFTFFQPSLVIKDPDLIKEIGIKEFDSFMDHRRFISEDLDPMWSKNLFAMRGEKWRNMRTILSPSFTGNKMKLMFPLINDCAQQFVTYFQNHESEIAELEIKNIFTRFTNDVIATTAFGITCDSLKDKNNEFYLMGKRATDFKGIRSARFVLGMMSPFLSKLLGIKLIDTAVAKYFTSIIKETIRIRKEEKIVRPDMIHLLMEGKKENSKIESQESENINKATTTKLEKEEISIEDIAAQAFVFFLAGFDTAANFISFTFYELSINPDVQTKLRQEIMTVKKQCNGQITYEAIHGMKYLDMVLSESLRKWPPNIATDRVVTKPFTIQPVKPGEKPLNLEVGTVIWLLQFPIQRDPQYYPDPDRFDPERFNEENKRNRNASTYIPFGIGPRLCIGSRFVLLEAKLLFYHLLQEFEAVPVARTPIPMVLANEFSLVVKDGLWLGFKKIQLTN